jgi:NADPH-dependent 2,4-dienoyl-CoA reductase/sulfur reductase-like enzyme
MPRRLVIIGGDAAGMSAATQVRRMSAVDELEIIAVRTHHEVTAIDVEASTVTVRDLDAGLVSAVHFDESSTP